MRKLTKLIGLCCLMFLPLTIFAQVIVISTAHFAPNEDFKFDEWLEGEKMYHDSVTMKNEFIANSATLYHLYTDDNSEILFITAYENWDDIPKADERNEELAKAVWPDDDERRANFRKMGSYYTTMHSDEIYEALPYVKLFETTPDTSMVYYFRMSKTARPPEDGSMKEAGELYKEFAENIIYKNEYLKGYHSMRHHYGADSRDFLEIMIVDSMADLDKLNERHGELIEAYWSDEEERKAFMDKLGKYFVPWHGDRLYSSEPALMK